MKMFFTTICICLNFIPVFAYTSKASKFAEEEYAKKNNCKKVQINMKKEYSAEFQQKSGEKMVYGWGDMRCKCKDKEGRKKCRITYVVFIDESGKPRWSSINFYQ